MFTPEKLAGLNQILSKRRMFSPEDIRNIATYFKLQESKCRIWFKENGARLRRQACSVRILPDPKKSSSDRRKSYVLKVRKRSSGTKSNPPAKGEKLHMHDDATSSSVEADAAITISNVEGSNLNAEVPENDVSVASLASEETSDEPDVGIKLTFGGKEVSSDTDTENYSIISEATVSKQESGSDESKSTVSVDGDSSMLSSGLGVQRTRDRFFYELPFDKQILLLKRTQHLATASSADAQKLATELDVPYRSVYSWLKSKTIRQSRTWSKRLSREKIAVLDGVFAASPNALTEERALLLSYELDLSVYTIRKYFERKKTEMKTDDEKQDCSSPAKVAQNVSEPSSSDHDTKEPNDDPSSSRDENIRNPLILVPQYIPSGPRDSHSSSSGIRLRPRPSSNDSKNQSRTSAAHSSSSNEKDSLRKRRFVLTGCQKKLLMQHFEKSHFIAPADASTLANKLGLPVKAVQLWFHRKRMEKNQGEASEMGESNVTNITDEQSAEEIPNI